jgi:FMN phosphatase YigB (HAD superfamily)
MTRRLIYEPRGIRFDKPDEDLEWLFWSAATAWAPQPGIEGVLDLLLDVGLPCGVVSNTAFRGATLARQLAIEGLDRPISWVIASADYVVRKPHRLLFELASRRLGTRPEETWFVGDSFECDVGGAAAAGMVPIWYHPAEASSDDCAPAAHAVASWSEFRELLEASIS